MPLQVGDHPVGRQRHARVGFDLRRLRHGEERAGNLVFVECLQVLEQTHPVDGIHGHDGHLLCHTLVFFE